MSLGSKTLDSASIRLWLPRPKALRSLGKWFEVLRPNFLPTQQPGVVLTGLSVGITHRF